MSKADEPAPAAFTVISLGLLCAFVGAFGGFILGSSHGINIGMKSMQQQAVEHDAGHWVITKDGTPVWKWGPVPKVEEQH